MAVLRVCEHVAVPPVCTQAREKRKMYPQAWAALEMANSHMRSLQQYSVESDLKTLDVLLNVFKGGAAHTGACVWVHGYGISGLHSSGLL